MTNNCKVIRLNPMGPETTGLQDMALDAADFESALPEQQIHVYFEDKELGLSVGVWTTTSMQEVFGPYPGDEFMCILEGQVKMVDADANETIVTQGESFYVRNAIPISWKQEGFLRKFYITFDHPKMQAPVLDSAEGGVMVFDLEQLSIGLEKMTVTDPFVIEGDKPVQHDSPLFTNDSGNMFVGLWDSTAFVSDMTPFPAHEFVQLLEGEVTIVEESGDTQVFTAGDVFFIPMGTVCQWRVTGYIKKYYAIVEPLTV